MVLDFVEKHVTSYKKLGLFLLIVTLVLSVPITASLLYEHQDGRTKAQVSSIPEQETTNLRASNIVRIASGDCSVDAYQAGHDSEEEKFVTLLNQYRQSRGLGAITSSSILSKMSAWMAKDVAVHRYFNHEPDSLGRTRYQRAADCGMTQGNLNSEIMTAGIGPANTAEFAIQQFKNSASHNDRMTDPAIRQVGVSRLPSGDFMPGGWVWVVNLQPYNDNTTAQIVADPTTLPTSTPIPVVASPVPSGTQVTGVQPTAGANNGTLGLSVYLPGIGLGENTNPISDILTEIYLTSSSNPNDIVHIRAPLEYSSNHVFTGSGPVPAGTYTMRIATGNSLKYTVPVPVQITAGQTTNLAEIYLVTGDINFDNLLDIQDYNTIISCISGYGCIGANKAYSDLNLDGDIDEQDLNIFYTGLANRKGD